MREKKAFAGKEQYVVVTGVMLACLILLLLVFSLTVALRDREELRMYNSAEMAFNSVFLALQDNRPSQAIQALNDQKIDGVGVYSARGERIIYLGAVPYRLPLYLIESSQGESSNGVAVYDDSTQKIEYIRYSRLTLLLDTGDIKLTDKGVLTAPVDFPDVLYIRFDGTDYHRTIVMIYLMALLSTIFVFVLVISVLKIYFKNRHYRMTLLRQESLVNLGQAARTLTHEIKNPLSAMTIQIALLKKILPPDYADDLHVIDEEIDRLIQLTNKVSDFLRNPLGSPARINVKDMFQSLIARFSDGIELECDESLEIEFDLDRARSVFENLLKNALESCSGRDPHVSVSCYTDRKRLVHICVKDRGDGIDPDAGKIFDPFYTTKVNGSGIGLAISRQFVKARGGSIKLYPREGGGTVAEVILPEAGILMDKERI